MFCLIVNGDQVVVMVIKALEDVNYERSIGEKMSFYDPYDQHSIVDWGLGQQILLD